MVLWYNGADREGRIAMKEDDVTLQDIIDALNPYGYLWLVSITGISGPGNYIVVFASMGDFHTACINHRAEVLWCHSCGGSEG